MDTEDTSKACTLHANLLCVRDPGREVADVLGLLLRRSTRSGLYRQLTEDINVALDATTYPVISGLARYGPLSAAGLAHEIGIDRSVVSRHASRLEAQGLLSRTVDPKDQRARLLTLTQAGHEAVAIMRQRLANAFNSYFDGWPRDQAEQFASDFRTFVESGPFSP
jgi:DNA-binding MarR family transcriptional regulator